MGLFDVFRKNDKGEGTEEFQNMERSTDAPSAEEVREAVNSPAEVKQPEAAPQRPKGITLPAITPNKLMSINNPDIIAREDKARVLGYYIERYNNDKTLPNLQNCLKSYAETWLWVPMRMQFSRGDAEGLKSQTPERKYIPKDPVRLVPELLRNPNGDVLYFAFTSRDEISEPFMQKYVWMQMPSTHCGVFLVKHSEIAALVINPFTKNLALKRDFITNALRKTKPDGNETPLS